MALSKEEMPSAKLCTVTRVIARMSIGGGGIIQRRQTVIKVRNKTRKNSTLFVIGMVIPTTNSFFVFLVLFDTI